MRFECNQCDQSEANLTLCSIVISSWNYFWFLGVYFFWRMPITNPSARFPLSINMPQHSPPLHDDCTSKGKNTFGNNKNTWSHAAHYSGDIVYFRGEPRLFVIIQLFPLHGKCIHPLSNAPPGQTARIPSLVGPMRCQEWSHAPRCFSADESVRSLKDAKKRYSWEGCGERDEASTDMRMLTSPCEHLHS